MDKSNNGASSHVNPNFQGQDDEDDNLTLQREELEALNAIYGEDFLLEEEDPPTFTVSIRLNNGKKEASLMISFEPDYPKAAPPIYQLSIPWIRGDHKKSIYASLEQLYLDHIGESIVYIWVEKLRELLEEEEEEVHQQPKCDLLEEGRDENFVQQEKNPISDKLIASVSRLDCSDSTTSTTYTASSVKYNKNACNNTNIHTSTLNPSDGNPSSSNLFPTPPTPTQLYKYQHSHQNKTQVGCKIPNITTGDPFTDRKSTFQAHVAPIQDALEVRVVLDELYKNKKIASATHNMYAYRIFKEDKAVLQDCDDDGETHAGSRLLHLLQILDCRNVLVVVTRWYGGIQLHGDRFKHINNVARQLLELQGFLQNGSKQGK